jgi:hypothetical protein
MLDKAKDRVDAYIKSPDSILAIKLKFDKLKREFYAPPTPEWMERERILKSPKNIVFLYLEKKMEKDGITLENVVAKFGDKDKGYLTYDQFRLMVNSLKIGLTPHQITACIQSVDDDGDGFLDLKELQDVRIKLFVYIFCVYYYFIS